MKFQKTPVALAAVALCASLPFAAQAAPTVSIKTPASGQTLSGRVSGANCKVNASSPAGISRVIFWANSWQINNDYSAPWNCDFDTTRLKDGPYTFKAVAYDRNGVTSTAQISVTIKNSGTGGVTNQAPTVSITKPANGATVSGSAIACEALAADDKGVKQVQFYLGSTLLTTDTAAPYGCSIDTTKLANGSHTLKAVATDTESKTSSAQINLTVNNTVAPVAPTVSFKTPVNGQKVSGWLDGVTCEALATSSAGMSQVVFFMDSTQLNTEKLAPWNCTVDTSKYADGAHVLKAVATDAKGVSSTAQLNLTVQNGTPTATNQAPSVAFTSPTAGQTVSGTLAFAANAADDKGVAKVVFSVDATTLATRTAAPWTGSVDTKTLPNGTHQLKAVAYDTEGLTATSQVAINVQNTASSLPAGGKAVATFESLGLYWTPPSNPGAAGCTVTYRRSGDAAWKDGLALWYDTRNSECRGSLVHLTPDTPYEVQFSLPGQQPVAQANARTWSESFPIARTVYVPSGTATFAITEGGTPNGYVLYTSAPGTQAVIDVADVQDYNVTVAAPYVIVRGLTLKGAKQDGIRLLNGAYNVVIEDNDISGWGRYRATNSAGWKLGMDMDAGVRAACRSFSTPLERVVIQRNRIHDPRYGANSWSWGHPAGPQGITLSYCGGNHVIRYNEIYSADKTRSFNDAIGGEDNFSTTGFPNADTDIYGNKISNAWDDAIEAEGGNKNVRIWGNYIDQTAIGIASTVVHHGPLYIFRNVYNRSRQLSEAALDSDDRNTSLKAGTVSSYGNGRRYVFHNTTLQATQPGVVNPLGAGAGLKGNSGQPLTNTVSRNNIFHIWKSGWSAIAEMGGSGNDLDYDLRNGGVSAYSGAEQNGLVGFPQYQAGHGWQSESGGLYQLAPTSPGYDRGVRLPNFNDGYTGAGPDMGAHEAGTPAMRLGVNGSGVVTQ